MLVDPLIMTKIIFPHVLKLFYQMILNSVETESETYKNRVYWART